MTQDLMAALHAVIVAALGVVVMMLRQQSKTKGVNGAGDLYKRIEAAEQRMHDKMEATRTEILAAIREASE